MSRRRIEQSKALVVLIPRAPMPSDMLNDLRVAREHGKQIIAVLRSGYTMPAGLDDALVVRADTPDAMADEIAKLVRA